MKIQSKNNKCLKNSQAQYYNSEIKENLWEINKIFYNKANNEGKNLFSINSNNNNEGKNKLGFSQFILKENCEFLISFNSLENPKNEKFPFEEIKKLFFINYENEKLNFLKRIDDFQKNNEDNKIKEVTQYGISNLIGGITYYYGLLKSDNKDAVEEKAVFSCTPSRLKFPRGFLWDEGIKQLKIKF